ncbi:hypothetical protein KQX54_017919 [Cotesia glomerata]|uniref:Uncharacterized protein n=1 Tax=Cotesia glomerata TaxID=32391 RepID=A0AAV7IEV8_COTGL|nr:hypothetical protein KQX54_017919 [Cotesia glomerata]
MMFTAGVRIATGAEEITESAPRNLAVVALSWDFFPVYCDTLLDLATKRPRLLNISNKRLSRKCGDSSVPMALSQTTEAK